MIPHTYTAIELATIRQQEILAMCERARLAANAKSPRRARPDAIAQIRARLGSLLITLGTLMSPPDHAVGAMMPPAAMGHRAPGQ